MGELTVGILLPMYMRGGMRTDLLIDNEFVQLMMQK